MVGGAYYAAVGHIPWQIFAASIPYGLLCTAVLMGKHIEQDSVRRSDRDQGPARHAGRSQSPNG